MEEQKITQTPSIKLSKSAVSGNYGWTIVVCNDNLKEAVEEIKEIDGLVKEKFGDHIIKLEGKKKGK